MTGGFDEGYGSAGSSRVPTEGPDDEHANGDLDAGEASLEAESDAPAVAEIPRHTRPFRAWGAAQERDTGPSLWERFVAWLRSTFSRKKDDEIEIDENGDIVGGVAAPDEAVEVEEVEEVEEVIVVEEVAAIEEVVAVEEVVVIEESPAIEEIAAAPAADADPLWDAPAIAEASPIATPTLEARDFAEVWTPREEAPPAAEPKKGFFGRIFSRKSKDQPAVEAEPVAEVTALEPADADFADDSAAAAAPADDDFATSAPAMEAPSMEAPSIDDFAIDTPPSAPSLDHSAEDAASLAAFLGTPVPAPVEPEPALPEPEAALPEPELALPEVEAALPEFEPEPEPEPQPVAETPAMPVLDPGKKPGFFSSLLKRVSRSQFIPKAAAEPEPPAMPAMELEAVDAAIELPVVEEPAVAELPVVEPEAPAEDLAAKWGPPPVIETPAPAEDDLASTVPTPMPAVPHPGKPVPVDSEFEATQPFPAFRDARDDFEEEKPEPGRPTEKVEVPAFDEGEKTDEFEVVPPEAAAEATQETRQVAGFFGRLFGRKEEPAPVSGETSATPAPVDDKTPFVLAKFRTFYNEIIRDKHQKSDVISGFATAVMGAPGASDGNDPEFAAQLLSKRLSEMLELQAAESNWTGGDAAKYYPEAQYAMVALADETFATIDWAGRSSWHKHMLEPRMYGTRGADLEFFKRIDKLLKEAPDEKGARDLARLYLMVIASGYRGKFRVPNVRRPLAEYRRRLYEFSHQADALELYARERRVFPQAAAHTLVSRSVGRFTPAQKWLAVVLVLAVLYIGVSHYAWLRVSADLRDVMSRIQTSISQPAPR